MGMTIECMYSCTLCGIIKAHVEVACRTDDEDISDWVKNVCVPTLCDDHAKRSPSCHPEKLSEVYIPITGSKFI